MATRRDRCSVDRRGLGGISHRLGDARGCARRPPVECGGELFEMRAFFWRRLRFERKVLFGHGWMTPSWIALRMALRARDRWTRSVGSSISSISAACLPE